MSYHEKALQSGRIPCAFIEQDMDFCSRTYGEGLCESAIGVTGSLKCFNTYATCQDKPHWDKTVKTYRYCTPNTALPVGIQAFPLIKPDSIQFSPQVLTPGKGLGVRGGVSVKMLDMPFSDAGVDPYLESRPYNPIEQGTFWGKFRARNPFYLSRPFRVLTGFIAEPFSWDDFQAREYVADTFKGPNRDAEVEWSAKDVLALADDKKAVCPLQSSGQLIADITNADTSITLVPVGIGDLEYPLSGRIVVGGEGMDFTRVGDVLTVTRDVYGTGAKEHKAADTAQIVKRFILAEIQDVIDELLTDYTPSFKPEWIPKDEWDTERDTFLPGSWSSDITEPTGVNTLIGELTEEGTCYLWWDEINRKVRFKALRKPDDNIETLSDEDHNLHRSMNLIDDMSQRVSQVVVHFDRIDPVKKLDEMSNFRQHYYGPDPESSGPNEHGIKAIKSIYSRWFTNASLGRVQALSDTLLKRYTNPPRIITYKLDASNAQPVGEVFWASTRGIQDVTGARDRANMMVIESRETVPGSVYELKAQENIWNPRIQETTNLKIYISRDELNVNLYDRFVSEYGTPITGQNIQFIIMNGVVAGGAAAAMGGVDLAYYSGTYRELYGFVASGFRDTEVFMHPLIRHSIGARRKFEVGSVYNNAGIDYQLTSTLWEVPPSYAIDTGDAWPAGVNLSLLISPGADLLGESGTASMHVGTTGGSAYAPHMFLQAVGPVRSLGIASDGGHALIARYPITVINKGTIGGGGAGGLPYPVCLRSFQTFNDYPRNLGIIGRLSGEGAGSNRGRLPAPIPTPIPPNGLTYYFSVLSPNRREAAVGTKLTGGLGSISRFVAQNYFSPGDPSTYDGISGAGGAIAAGSGNTSTNIIHQSGYGWHDFPTRAWVSGVPGKAVVGDSFITWAETGTRYGAIES